MLQRLHVTLITFPYPSPFPIKIKTLDHFTANAFDILFCFRHLSRLFDNTAVRALKRA